MGLTEALLCQWYGATNWDGLWYQCYLPFFGFLLQSLLHIHSVILYFTHNPSSCPTTSSRKAFVPDHFHYVSLVVAIVCCHCYPTLFFPTKRTELNEMLHFQFQFLWLFFQPLEFSCPLSATLKTSLIYVIFSRWKYLCAVIKSLFDLFNKLNRRISSSLLLSDPRHFKQMLLQKKAVFCKAACSTSNTHWRLSIYPLQNSSSNRHFEAWLPQLLSIPSAFNLNRHHLTMEFWAITE